MELRDSFKCRPYDRGKVLPVHLTIAGACRRLRAHRPALLKNYRRFHNPSRIPHYQVFGTAAYRDVVGTSAANGKGASWPQALASGLMEMAERFSCRSFLRTGWAADCACGTVCSPRLFRHFLRQYPRRNCHGPEEEVSAFLCRQKYRWYPVFDLQGRRSWLPLGFIDFMLQGCNGMAAGNSIEEAVLHGACEVIERHCLASVQCARLRVPDIELDSAPQVARRLIARFRSAGLPLRIKDFSCGLELPAIGVVRGISPSRYLLTVGVASSPSEALVRALTENAQSQTLSLSRSRAQLRHLFCSRRQRAFSELADISSRNIKQEVLACAQVLERHGMELFFACATHPRLAVPSVIVHVRGARFSWETFEAGRVVYRPVLMGLLHEACAAGEWSWVTPYAGLIRRPVERAFADFYHAALMARTGRRKTALKDCLAVVRNRYATREMRNGAACLLSRLLGRGDA